LGHDENKAHHSKHRASWAWRPRRQSFHLVIAVFWEELTLPNHGCIHVYSGAKQKA
jgi:hypothetical protein